MSIKLESLDRLRAWRNDAMTQHLYETAIFWGRKIVEVSVDPNDAFWLAQIYFLMKEYAFAERLLNPKSGKRLAEVSLACRYLTAQCMIKQSKWDAASDLLGEDDPWKTRDAVTDTLQESSGIKFEASICHLRGLMHLQNKADDKAKMSFMEAISLDVRCYESFDMLIKTRMLTPDEEWKFVQTLEYTKQCPEDAEFIKHMYIVRLSRPDILQRRHQEEINNSNVVLCSNYGMNNDPDVLYSTASKLFSQCKWGDSLDITQRILQAWPSHRSTLIMHLTCMHHLSNLRSSLFLLAHELVQNNSDSPITWYAVGLWYFGGKRWDESRRFFGKALMLDSRFSEAWMAFAHAYAMESEHDQAITSYSTAQRHAQGDPLPTMYIGMQNLLLSNLDLASEYLNLAASMCSEDPYITNELGVLAFYKEEYQNASKFFIKTLSLAESCQSSSESWIETHLNLGHSYRKQGKYSEARQVYVKAIDLAPDSSDAYVSLALVQLAMLDRIGAMDSLHEALAFSPAEPIATSLLKLAMEAIDLIPQNEGV